MISPLFVSYTSTKQRIANFYITKDISQKQSILMLRKTILSRMLNLPCIYAVYCRSGEKSADACNRLSAEGYNVVSFILAWIDEKMPVS